MVDDELNFENMKYKEINDHSYWWVKKKHELNDGPILTMDDQVFCVIHRW
jgi:hypothetical protein